MVTEKEKAIADRTQRCDRKQFTKPTLIIVSGFSCTGKTTLAHKLGDRFSLPVFGRDDFKESLFDSLGYKNCQRSKEFGIASYQLLYLTTEKILATGNSVIIESNFKINPDTEKLKSLRDKYQCNLIQIHCYTTKEIALARFKKRSLAGKRHPGHVDHLILKEMAKNFDRGGYEILDICGHTLKIDASDFAAINWEKVFQWFANKLT